MSGLSRIGGLNKIDRDVPSDGLEKMHGGKETPQRNAKVDEVAKLYEKQFLREMTKAMRSTVQFGNDKPSMGESIYREQLDNEYVESWGEQGGIGLSDLIYQQLMDRYFEGPGQKLKGSGPITLTDRDVTRVSRVPTQAGAEGQLPLRVETKPSEDGSPAKLTAPWNATVLSKAHIDGKTSITLGHSGGLKSTLMFKGVASSEVESGKVLEKGKVMGILSPEVHSFFWNLARPSENPDAGRVP